MYSINARHYTTWVIDNQFNPDVLTISGVKPMPKRFCVTGIGPGIDSEDKEVGQFRYEVHPNEMLEIIHRYCPPGGLVCDSTAGCLVTAYACLRLGAYCIVGDSQTNGNMLDNSWERLCQAYEFLRDEGLLPTWGSLAPGPTWWEKMGITWMQVAQRLQQQAAIRDKRRLDKEEREAEIREFQIERVRRRCFGCSVL